MKSNSINHKMTLAMRHLISVGPLCVALGACLLASVSGAVAQKKPEVKPSYAWTIIQPMGLRQPAAIDTNYIDYSRQSVPSEVSDARALTGNLGASGQNRIWAGRGYPSVFFFEDALDAWLPLASRQKFYNTRIPMTLLSYNTGGGKESAQDRLRGVFSGNINRRAQVGAMLDYLYSKGSYQYQAVKDLSWGINGSYIGDRFEFQGFYNHWNMLQKENGGITDALYITDPGQMQGGDTHIDAKAIPTNLTAAHSRIVGGQLLLNSRYKVGRWHEERDQNDSVTLREYIPVTSFVWTLDYKRSRHIFVNDAPGEAHNFFDATYLDDTRTYDKTTYHTFENTVGVALLEGFHRYAKFGLSAYFKHRLENFHQTPDTMLHQGRDLTPFPEGYDPVAPQKTRHLGWVGAQLTKQRGSLLTYTATAQLGMLGDAAGDVSAEGTVATRFRLFGDSVTIAANARFENRHPLYLLNHYVSNHFVWHNDFGKTRNLRIGGTLDIPHTGSRLQAGVENVQNHIYFGPQFTPVQHSGSVQVFWARLDQRLKARAWHWDNSVTYQTSGNDDVISLPSLAVYSNMYVTFRIATLHVQLGVDCDWYTKYYSPAYQPATMTFATQKTLKTGNYPFMNVYANMRLDRARFYVMMSHVNQGWLGGSDYFSMPLYPLNPRRFQLGISVDFAN